jgi:hypothetical protein
VREAAGGRVAVRSAALLAAAAAVALAGCATQGTPHAEHGRSSAAVRTAPPTTSTATVRSTTDASRPSPPKAHRRVAPVPPPVADPQPTSAAEPSTSATGVSPGAPSDAQVRRELARGLHLKAGDATTHALEDTAQLTPDGLAVTPPAAPAAVEAVIRGGNRVAHAPYVYGGGHGTWFDTAYDCSGSVSFALASAGLLKRQMDSTSLEQWGRPGRGKWITVYANAGHAWMTVAGLRFDTSGRTGVHGSRWQPIDRTGAGFVARHPPGL